MATALSDVKLANDNGAKPALLAAIAAVCFFCVLCSYYLIRPIREQFASAAGGSQALPLLYALVLVCMLILTPVYGALVARFSRRIFVPVVYGVFLLCMLGLGPLFATDLSTAVKARIFYVWVSVDRKSVV